MFYKRYATLLLLCVSVAARAQPDKTSLTSIETLIRSKQYDQALQTAESALKENPKDFRLWTLEAIVFSIQKNDQDAFDAFDKALKLSPNYPPALKGEAQLLYASKDQRAAPLLEKILQADPKDATAHEMLAVLQERQGKCEAANQQFLLIAEVIAAHPDSLEAYGNCLVQAKELAKAVPVFEQLSALLPQRMYPKYDLAVALVESQQYEAALKVLEPLLTADPPDPDVLSLASEAYEGAGNTPKAVAVLRQAIVLSPANAAYYTSFAAICLDHESFQVGIDMIDAGMKRIPNDPSLYISRGLLYAQLAQYDRAEADFKTAEQLDSAQSISSFAMDLAEMEKNNSESTLAQVRSQLKLHPDSPMLLYLLAKLLSTQTAESGGKLSEEAVKSAQMAVELKPDMVDARDLLAGMYANSGKYGLAIEQCRMALKSNPSDQTAIYHLIVALRHSGQGEQRDEIQTLVKRLAELQKESRQQETDKKRFKLVEQSSAPPG